MSIEISEKILDKSLDEAFKASSEFVNWFLSHTKFSNKSANYHWSRSDSPWCRMPVTIIDKETGIEKKEIRDSETDVLVVFETENLSRFALHIENKLAGGHFTPYQPILYHQRAKHWMGDKKYHEYTDYETVLIAPKDFHEKYKKDSQIFDSYISHEDISVHLPIFKV